MVVIWFGLASGGRFQPLWGQKANFWYIWATKKLFTCNMVRILPGIQWAWSWTHYMFGLTSGGRFQPLWGQKANFWYIWATEKLFTCNMVRILPEIQWTWSLDTWNNWFGLRRLFQPPWGQKANFWYITITSCIAFEVLSIKGLPPSPIWQRAGSFHLNKGVLRMSSWSFIATPRRYIHISFWMSTHHVWLLNACPLAQFGRGQAFFI